MLMNEKNRTPFVKQADGRTALFLIEGKTLEWGWRFDAEIGYRVMVKYTDSDVVNVFLPRQARRIAGNFSKEQNTDVLQFMQHMKDLANTVEKMNTEWAAQGMPDLSMESVAGHA